MSNKKWKIVKLIVLATVLTLSLGACSSKDSANPATDNRNAVTAGAEGTDSSGQRPEHLPKDFPLPDDAVITTSHSEQNDGKKSALLIFTSQEKLDKLADMYKDYFREQGIEDAAETIDEKNLIIQGDTADESWSLIGGALSAQEGTNELTLTWSEL